MLKVSSKIKSNLEEAEDDANLNDFKGLYYNDNQEQKYYEGGAHFKYTDLCNRLEIIVNTLTPDRKGRSMYEDYVNPKLCNPGMKIINFIRSIQLPLKNKS